MPWSIENAIKAKTRKPSSIRIGLMPIIARFLTLERPEGRRGDTAAGGGFIGGGDLEHDIFPAGLGAEHQRERQSRLGQNCHTLSRRGDIARAIVGHLE